MPKLRPKQKAFIKEYLANGQNGTQAALKVYNAKTYQTANVIASENIRKPYIKEELDRLLQRKGLQIGDVLENIKGLASTQPHHVSSDVVLKSNIELLKLHNAYPDKISKHLSLTGKLDFNSMDYNQLLELHKANQVRIKELLED